MYRQRTRALPARAPSGFSCACSPRSRGTLEEQSAAVPAAEARATHTLSLLILGPSVTRRRADGKARAPRGCARGIARIPLQDRMSCQRNPGRPQRTRRLRRARHRGCVLFGYFLLHKHCAAGAARTAKPARRAKGRMPGVTESNAPARMAGKTHRDVSRLSRKKKTVQRQTKKLQARRRPPIRIQSSRPSTAIESNHSA